MKNFLRRVLPFFIMLEGIGHFLFSTWSCIWLIITHDFHAAAWFLPMVDYFFGVVTFLGGWVFKENHHKH